jgi:CHAD domain-containing protein
VLHDLRVAWRRMRAVLDVLKCDKHFKVVVGEVRRAGSQVSSPLRDFDVLAQALVQWCEADGETENWRC